MLSTHQNTFCTLFGTVLLGLLYAVHLHCSETIVLSPKDFSKIKIRFDFASSPNPQDDLIQPSSPIKGHLNQELVNSVIDDKLSKLKSYLQHENKSNTSYKTVNSVVLLEPFTVTVSRANYDLNVSLDTIEVSGISGFTFSDIFTNVKSRKTSALLRFPDIRVSMYYKVNGVVSDPSQPMPLNNKNYNDKGKLVYTPHGWRTTFSGKVVDIVNTTKLMLSGFSMRSHYDFFESNQESFVHGQDRQQLIEINKSVASELMKKVINALDDKLESTMLDHLDVYERSTWSSLKDFDKEEDGPLLMMESKINEQPKRRRKRQVPCEVGEELDEYVDSLFRFLKRLIRVMEPFNLPNATIELEEYNLQIFLHSGGATRAYTFERKKPAWVLCQNETTTLGLTVKLEDVRVHYKYRVIQDWRLLFDGDLEAQLRGSKAQLQITQLNPPENEDEESDGEEESQVQQRLDKLKVWKPGQIVVLIRGLGNLSSALSMIVNQMLTDTSTLDPIISMIETDGVVAVNEMLRNVTIPIFSII